VRRLLLLLQLDPGNKVIVFSSWLDVLDILSHALTANGICHAFGRGKKGFLQALEQFKGCAVAAAELQAAARAGRSAGLAKQQQGSNKRQREEGEAAAAAAEQIAIDTSDADEAEEAAAAASAAGAGASSTSRPRVLLMLVTHGAAGLNLTEAQHVVLVEPLLDPAQELQATGRISRFGQTATTHVHR
jgi:E3 ubiquitin-protein ligase SHPRH